MYGFIHCALSKMVIAEHTEEKWADIIRQSEIEELEGGDVKPQRRYSDVDTTKLFQATADVLDVSLAECLETLGEHLFRHCLASGYHSTLRALGANLLDFLSNLDALQEHLEALCPGVRPPSVRCAPADDGGRRLLLHYTSERADLYPIAVGAVRAAALEFFNVSVLVEPVAAGPQQQPAAAPVNGGSADEETVLSITQEDEAAVPGGRRRSSSLVGMLPRLRASTSPADLPLGVATFCRAFPFHVMFDRRMQVVQAGAALLRLMRRTAAATGRPCPLAFPALFAVVRPVIEPTFAAVLNHLNSVFVVATRPAALRLDDQRGSPGTASCLRLKGQMVYVRESDCLLLLASPRVLTSDDLRSRRLFLSDIPLHDATRDLILITQARRAERELVEKLEETSTDLRRLQARLQDDKQRTDRLLLSILPSNVAARLRHNLPVEAEKYQLVTVLFSDIVQFTKMCGNERVVAMDIVRMLNRLYTLFDMLIELNGLYKVETIGDAYMVVGGMPTFTRNHADRALSMAFGMIEVSERVLSPVDQQPIQLRIGIHSGPCVAGVVGQKMPRYCLFGNTVAVASAMETLSQPGRINISKGARSYLTDTDLYTFTRNTSSSAQEAYYVSMSPGSPLLVAVDLSVPVPKGMFRTPNPSPPGTRPSSPVESALQLTVPDACTPDRPPTSPQLQMPTITVVDAEDDDSPPVGLRVPLLSFTYDRDSVSSDVELSPPVMPRCQFENDDDNDDDDPLATAVPQLCCKTAENDIGRLASVCLNLWANEDVDATSNDRDVEKGSKEAAEMESRRKLSRTAAVDYAVDCNGVHERSTHAGVTLQINRDAVSPHRQTCALNVTSDNAATSSREFPCHSDVTVTRKRPSTLSSRAQTCVRCADQSVEGASDRLTSSETQPETAAQNGCRRERTTSTSNESDESERSPMNGLADGRQVARKHSLVVYFRPPKDAERAGESDRHTDMDATSLDMITLDGVSL